MDHGSEQPRVTKRRSATLDEVLAGPLVVIAAALIASQTVHSGRSTCWSESTSFSACRVFDSFLTNSPLPVELVQRFNVCREPPRPHLMFPHSDHHMELLAVLVVSCGARVHDQGV